MKDIIPIFNTQSSIGKSILTAKQICGMAKEAGLQKVCIVDDTMIDLMNIKNEFDKNGLSFWFGINFDICNDLGDMNEAIESSKCKMICFIQNDDGYESIVKFYTEINTSEKGLIDYKTLREKYSNCNLKFAIPFYNSFIERNSFYFSDCIPDFSGLDVCFLLDNNDLPFDSILRGKAIKYAKNNSFQTQEVKYIFYKNKDDFDAYVVNRIKNNNLSNAGRRSSFDCPNLPYMSSDSFCFEKFLDESKNGRFPKKIDKFNRKYLLKEKKDQKYIIFDTETEGLNLFHSRPWEIAWVEMIGDRVINKECHLLKWDNLNLSEGARRVTGFDDAYYEENAEDPKTIIEKFWGIISNPEYIIVGQNILGFDIFMLNIARREVGLEPDYSYLSRCIDTVSLSRAFKMKLKKLKSDVPIEWCYKLINTRLKGRDMSVSQINMLKALKINHDEGKLHSALYDTEKCGELFMCLINYIDI